MSSDGSRAARAVELGRRLVGLTPESGARGPCLRISPVPVVAAMTTLCARLVRIEHAGVHVFAQGHNSRRAGSIASPHTVQFIRLPPLWGYPLAVHPSPMPSIHPLQALDRQHLHRSGPRPSPPPRPRSPTRPSTSITNPALNVTAQALDLDRPVEAPESCGRGIPPARPPSPHHTPPWARPGGMFAAWPTPTESTPAGPEPRRGSRTEERWPSHPP